LGHNKISNEKAAFGAAVLKSCAVRGQTAEWIPQPTTNPRTFPGSLALRAVAARLVAIEHAGSIDLRQPVMDIG
jgi:hypothetical protein